MFQLSRRKTVSQELFTYLGPKAEVKGLINAEGVLRVDGTMLGTVVLDGDLEISTTGFLEGPELSANNVTVQGKLKVNTITVRGTLSLGSTGRIEGDIVANSVQIEPGAYYVGHIKTHDSQASLPPASSVPGLYGSNMDR